MDNTKEFRCLSLCSGYAGIELGLKRVVPNLRTVAYVEIEAFACANLVAKMEAGKLDVAPIWTDIKTFDGRPFHKRVHIITAGYPCQGESCAGKRRGKDDPRWLWPYIERIIEAIEPIWFFGENVSGHLTLGFPAVYRSLRDLGYSVEAELFTAAECGAPHRRERLFVLAKSSRTTSSNQDGQAKRGTRQANVPQRNGQTCSIRLGAASQLADTSKTEFQGWQSQQENNGTECPAITGSCYKWPARPGQPQYEWEEPRVVEYTNKRRLERTSAERQGRNDVVFANRNKSKGQAQSRLGGAIDGTRSRVDRLRLLGNGVVPQQAEKAFRYLMKKF